MTFTLQPSLDHSCLNRRGFVVAVAGIAFSVTSQALLVEGSRDRLRSESCANRAAVAAAHRISAQKSSERGEGCARTDVRPARPSGIVPKPQWGSLGTDSEG